MAGNGWGVPGALRRRLAVVIAVLTASGVLALAAPGAAHAASSPCAGRKVRTLSFSTGSVLVFRNGDWVCAYTLQKHPGRERSVSVSVQARGQVPVRRSREHTRSSPPVKVHAGHRLVRVKGSVGRASTSSGWIRC
ncbi:hypothetical protein [Streptomyces sp. NPDC002588]|uniref:hypothetical protein n=1 Tax=Streptomyces sp. NPDC002588 TaxID=3154419 RepID=UPI00332E30D0